MEGEAVGVKEKPRPLEDGAKRLKEALGDNLPGLLDRPDTKINKLSVGTYQTEQGLREVYSAELAEGRQFVVDVITEGDKKGLRHVYLERPDGQVADLTPGAGKLRFQVVQDDPLKPVKDLRAELDQLERVNMEYFESPTESS